ncbi:hypothetical protein BX666DRAFT_2028910 [Dichotomocladium elegans]|nr:hypothetical protein BX666DRAFT_2028910 [Dichotomocladium elegans]
MSSARRSRPSKKRSDRAEYLSQLAQEYIATSSLSAKQQVLANLANFAYNPQNYANLWQINAVDLFIAALAEHDALLKEFGTGGLANICQDRSCTESLKDLVVQYSKADHHNVTANTVLNAIIALMELLETSSCDGKSSTSISLSQIED